jgi:hypothetical protein
MVWQNAFLWRGRWIQLIDTSGYLRQDAKDIKGRLRQRAIPS